MNRHRKGRNGQNMPLQSVTLWNSVCLCPPLRLIAMLLPRHWADVSDGGLT